MDDGRNILLVSYYFPPLGMGGVGRPCALARYLPQHGYNVHVVTVKDIVYPNYDDSPLENLDRSKIYRTNSLDPARVLYLAGKRKQRRPGYPSITGKLPLYLPDLKRGWNPFAASKASAIIEKYNIETVITTSPPPSTHLIGLKLKSRFGIKWIADFRDFWFPLPIEKIYRSRKLREYSFRLKDRITSRADGIIAVNEDIRDYYGRGEVICNGADEALYDIWREHDAKTNEFRIGLYGTFNELIPLEPLLKAIKLLRENCEEANRRIAFRLAGHIDDSLVELIDHYGLRDRVDLLGYLPKEDAIMAMAECNLFYLGVKSVERFHILPGRTFDLMLSGKLIIGLVPSGSAIERKLTEYPQGCAVTNEADLFKELEKHYLTPKTDLEPLSKEELYRYTSRRLAEEYAEVLNRI